MTMEERLLEQISTLEKRNVVQKNVLTQEEADEILATKS